MINYLQLPPGRQRGIEYANYIEARTLTRRRINRMRYLNSHISRLPHRTPIRINNIQNNLNIDGFSYERFSQLEDIKVGLINKNLLNNSKVTNNFDNYDFLCVICQDDIEISDIIRILKCNHMYHIYCIDKWFTENKKCPT